MAKGNIHVHESSQSFTRTGEGSLVSASVVHEVGANGSTSLSMNINLSEAPVPDRRYVADFVAVVYKDDAVKIIFGQEKLGNAGVRSCLVITFNTYDANYFVQTLDEMKNPNLAEILEGSGITSVANVRQIEDEPAQTVALSANLVICASSGRSTCMDFYSVSAFAFANVQKSKKIPVDPVVRIDLSTMNLIALHKELKRLIPSSLI